MRDEQELDPRVAAAFYGRFADLRPAQAAAIRPLLDGRNVVLSSGTGSGKTEAVMAPLVSRVWRGALRHGRLAILYVAPTKALANDLEKRLAPPLATLGLKIGVRHGDRDDLSHGQIPHVLLTTPESLDVLLFRHDQAIMSVEAVVVDEVHLLYNTQRGLQLSVLLRRLTEYCGRDLQVAMLSATIGSLSHVTAFVLGDHGAAVELPFPATRTIDAQIRYIPNEDCLLSLAKTAIGGKPTKLLVFANSRRECERLAGVLCRDEGLRPSVFAHYSSLSPDIRLETEKRFAGCRTAICIATSTLELGVDIGDIDAVFLWGVPGSVESFLQRIGRGNRRSAHTNVVCLIPDTTDDDIMDALRFAILVDCARHGQMPVRRPYELYGAAAQQAMNLIASRGGSFTRVADICGYLAHRQHLGRCAMDRILAELAQADYLVAHGFKNQYGSGENLHRLVDLRLIYGNFGMGSQVVSVLHASKHLGDVPAINLLRVRSGDLVRFAGKCWRVKRVSREQISVLPVPRVHAGATDFMYPGGAVGWDPFLTDRLWQFLHSSAPLTGVLHRDLHDRVTGYVARVARDWPEGTVPYLREADGVRYWTFAGYLVNKAIGLVSRKPSFEAGDLCLKLPSPIDWGSIPTEPVDYESVFPLLFEVSSEQSVCQSLLPLDLQQVEFLQDWLRDETIPAVLTRLQRSRPLAVSGLP